MRLEERERIAPVMSKLYVQLAKIGDILGILPFLYADFKNTGEKPRLMVAKEFSGVLDGVSYIDPIIFDGHYSELERAAKLSDSMSSEVVVTQVNAGRTTGIETYLASKAVDKTQNELIVRKDEARAMTGAVTDAFNKEQWQLAGRLEEWEDCLPLVFDQRDPEREAKLLRDCGITHKRGKKKPLLLLSLGGLSSPFPYADLLRELVSGRFGQQYRIMELPQCERIYDLLALYEHADLLIATDSAPLHLAWAVRELPVFALTQDRAPNGSYSLWHGSAWRPNHLWYCRYHDFSKRAVEMIDAICNLSKGLDGLVVVRNEYGGIAECPTVNGLLPIRVGTCGRDSFSVLGDSKRHPYLLDVIKLSMQRAKNDSVSILIERPGVVKGPIARVAETPIFYAYRIQDGNFRPVVDLFCATKQFWKMILPEIPDMLLDNSHYWDLVLWSIFKKHGASDATGCCSFVKGEK